MKKNIKKRKHEKGRGEVEKKKKKKKKKKKTTQLTINQFCGLTEQNDCVYTETNEGIKVYRCPYNKMGFP